MGLALSAESNWVREQRGGLAFYLFDPLVAEGFS